MFLHGFIKIFKRYRYTLLLQHFTLDQKALQPRINQLFELDESIRKTFENFIGNQDKVKTNFDRKAQPRVFKEGDTVLMWDKRSEKLRKHVKFDNLWLGPYRIKYVTSLNTFYLTNLDGEKV